MKEESRLGNYLLKAWGQLPGSGGDGKGKAQRQVIEVES